MSSVNNQELKVSDNTDYINKSIDNMRISGKKIIDSAVDRQVENYKKQLNKLPEIYQNMKNNLTLNNNKEIKRMNENIANTGNHTASGYAVSKRLDNINNYNKQLTEIDKQKNEAISDLKSKIEDAKFQGELDYAKLDNDINDKNLNYYLSEKTRQDNYNLNVAGFNESIRMNDSNIKKNESNIKKNDSDIEKNNISIIKTQNDMRLDNNEDLRKEDANRRENEIHGINMEYIPKKNEAELKKSELDSQLTLAKIEETKSKQNAVKSGTGGGGNYSGSVMSKMSSKAIADSIKEQIGSVRYDSSGNKTVKFSTDTAYALLRAWQKKYNLPQYIVNDASIYLGIQDYF